MASLKTALADWNTEVVTYQLADLNFPSELNDAVDKTTNKKNQIPNEQKNLDLALQESAGEVQKANREKFAITNEAVATVNKLIADNNRNMNIDTDKILKT